MIIVTQNATATLLKDLERKREEGSTERCIHLKLAGLESKATDWIDDVADYLDETIDDDKGRIFLCEDGDVMIIAAGLTRKKVSEVFLCVLPHLRPAPDPQGLVNFFELGVDTNALLVIAQEKYDVIAAAEQEMRNDRARLEMERLERQQRAVLNLVITPEMRQSIINKRKRREVPEILLVDDDAFSLKMAGNLLKDNFIVHNGMSGWEAIATYLKYAPDLVFLDIDMPDTDGYDILGKIFEIDPDAYVVMLSGFGNEENIVKAIKRGARGFIGKPFTREKIFQYLNACPQISRRKLKGSYNVQSR